MSEDVDIVKLYSESSDDGSLKEWEASTLETITGEKLSVGKKIRLPGAWPSETFTVVDMSLQEKRLDKWEGGRELTEDVMIVELDRNPDTWEEDYLTFAQKWR